MEKKLTRSRDQKVIAGVAGGLGKYLDIDPIILRIIMVIFTLFEGIGILVYIVMWIVIPEEAYENSYQAASSGEPVDPNKFEFTEEETVTEKTHNNGKTIIGVILIALGVIFLLDKFIPFFNFDIIFPAILIFVGLGLVFNFFNKNEKS